MKYSNFSSKKHIQSLISDPYYKNLLMLRDCIERSCDAYFRSLGAPKVDLYLMSKSVSSPIGLGSDSVPIDFTLGTSKFYLSDSSQFGMEPLVINSFETVYCYLPSFRGEDPDQRHLNQFYHCEAELRGDYRKAMRVAEGLTKYILRAVAKERMKKTFRFKKMLSQKTLDFIIRTPFPVVTFDQAAKILEDMGKGNLVVKKKFGRVLAGDAEVCVTKAVSNNTLPVWITHYDRDTVAFYQKPDKANRERVLNADLIFPPILKGAFGGEFIGLGQRQDNAGEIAESMDRQHIKNHGQYDWYLKLRKHPKYRTTSGFGMGIERLIACILGLSSIADASLYPVLKTAKTGF